MNIYELLLTYTDGTIKKEWATLPILMQTSISITTIGCTPKLSIDKLVRLFATGVIWLNGALHPNSKGRGIGLFYLPARARTTRAEFVQ